MTIDLYDFTDAARRSLQEAIAAINGTTRDAADAHAALAVLHVRRAVAIFRPANLAIAPATTPVPPHGW